MAPFADCNPKLGVKPGYEQLSRSGDDKASTRIFGTCCCLYKLPSLAANTRSRYKKVAEAFYTVNTYNHDGSQQEYALYAHARFCLRVPCAVACCSYVLGFLKYIYACLIGFLCPRAADGHMKQARPVTWPLLGLL